MAICNYYVGIPAIIWGIVLIWIAIYVGYLYGHYKGYVQGMDYGMEKLKEFAEYTSQGIKGLGDNIRH
jgi:Na+/H+ antiporter NhaC